MAGGDSTKAHCKLCKKSFLVNSSGVAQVKSHARSELHQREEKSFANQAVFSNNGKLSCKFSLTKEEEVVKAETLHTLHFVDKNYSYSSSTQMSELYRIMFPDSAIAKSFTGGATKISYLVKHGLTPYFEERLKNNISGVPFTFKFDETTTKQVKKQYDGYLCYWSNSSEQVENRYLGSLFVGHCTAADLVDHYLEFKQRWHLENHLLLHIGMDGPSVNQLFEKNLRQNFIENSNSEFLQLGTCSLHPVHTAFKKGISELDFPFESFFHDLSFYFHLSSARREDYKSIEKITEVTAVYVKKHGPTRWLSMKPVGTRVLEQIDNLREYFLNFLPKSKGFKKCERYERIVKNLKEPDLEAHLGFMLFLSQDFESFLREFQFDIPMIHMLWPKMAELIRKLMNKFVSKRLMYPDEKPVSNENIFCIDVSRKSSCKKASLIDIGTKAKLLFSGNLIPAENEEQFRKNCLKCFKVSVEYLLSHLPHNNKLIQYAQYLHPQKRNLKGSTNGISNAALYITQVCYF